MPRELTAGPSGEVAAPVWVLPQPPLVTSCLWRSEFDCQRPWAAGTLTQKSSAFVVAQVLDVHACSGGNLSAAKSSFAYRLPPAMDVTRSVKASKTPLCDSGTAMRIVISDPRTSKSKRKKEQQLASLAANSRAAFSAPPARTKSKRMTLTLMTRSTDSAKSVSNSAARRGRSCVGKAHDSGTQAGASPTAMIRR